MLGWPFPRPGAILDPRTNECAAMAEQGGNEMDAQESGLNRLQEAAVAGDLEALASALAQGCNVDDTDPFGRTALIMAAYNPETDRGYPECVERLLEAGADPNHRMHFGNTALMIAAGAGETEVCKVLLDRGADPSLANEGGVTALRMAYLTHRIDVVNLLHELTHEQLLGEGKDEGASCSTAQAKLNPKANVVQFVRDPKLGISSLEIPGSK